MIHTYDRIRTYLVRFIFSWSERLCIPHHSIFCQVRVYTTSILNILERRRTSLSCGIDRKEHKKRQRKTRERQRKKQRKFTCWSESKNTRLYVRRLLRCAWLEAAFAVHIQTNVAIILSVIHFMSTAEKQNCTAYSCVWYVRTSGILSRLGTNDNSRPEITSWRGWLVRAEADFTIYYSISWFIMRIRFWASDFGLVAKNKYRPCKIETGFLCGDGARVIFFVFLFVWFSS